MCVDAWCEHCKTKKHYYTHSAVGLLDVCFIRSFACLRTAVARIFLWNFISFVCAVVIRVHFFRSFIRRSFHSFQTYFFFFKITFSYFHLFLQLNCTMYVSRWQRTNVYTLICTLYLIYSDGVCAHFSARLNWMQWKSLNHNHIQ